MEKLLTVQEVCRDLQIDRDTLWRWRQRGRITALKTPGGGVRFREADVLKALQEEPASVL